MGRSSKFNEETLLDTALVVVGRDRKATTATGIAAAVGARIGSLYYRFASHEVLLLALWVCNTRRFQIDFLAAAGSFGDPGETLTAAAIAIPRYYREYPDETRSLTLFRYEEVLVHLEADGDEPATCPSDLREATRGLSDEVVAVMADLIRRCFGSLEPLGLVRIAVQQTTYDLVRPFLGSDTGPIPAWLGNMVAAMVFAALAVADRPGWSKGRGRRRAPV